MAFCEKRSEGAVAPPWGGMEKIKNGKKLFHPNLQPQQVSTS